MASEQKVWIAAHKLANGKNSYHLRWIDPAAKKWKSKSVGTDHRKALGQAAKLEEELAKGTYREVKAATWDEFRTKHVATIAGKAHKAISNRTIKAFGEFVKVPLRQVTKGDIKGFAVHLRTVKGNSPATVNKAIRYIRHAFNEAVEDGYIAVNPMGKRWSWEPEQELTPREITAAEETALLAKAEELYGFPFRSFLYFALNTGGRANEILGLPWKRIDMSDTEAAGVTFEHTKGGKPRWVPAEAELVAILKRLYVAAQADDGPFTRWDYDEAHRMFERTCKEVSIEDVTMHDMRRTFITRLIRANVELSAVQRLAGHSTIITTLKFYNAIHKSGDLRSAIAKLPKPQSCYIPATDTKTEAS